MTTKSVFSDALRQTERRTWELWDAVQTASRKIAEAARAESVTGVKVDVKRQVSDLIGEYAAELVPTIVEQIDEYVSSDTNETFYLKAQTMDNFFRSPASRNSPTPSQPVASDTLAYYGGAVKALGNGKIAGYGVLFSSVSRPDLQKEFFTKSTEYMTEVGDRRPVVYRHGMHPQIKARVLGKATVTAIDDEGVFFEGELNLRDRYEKAIYRLAEQSKLGFSTGSLPHLVEKELRDENGQKATEILTWPIGELSLTPAPVEPRTLVAVKDIVIPAEELDFEDVVKSVDQEEYDRTFVVDGTPSIKAFCDAVSPTSMKDGKARSEAAANATKEFITIGKLLGEGYHSYASRLVTRTENRFLKAQRELDPATVAQVDSLVIGLDQISTAFQSIKESLQGIQKISELSVNEQRALDLRVRAAMLNHCRMRGVTPEEFLG